MTLSPEAARALVDRAHEWLDAEPGRDKSNARRRFVRAVEREAGDFPAAYWQTFVAALSVAEAERKVRGLTR